MLLRSKPRHGSGRHRFSPLREDRLIQLLVLLAPALDFNVVENLSERAAKKSLEIVILQLVQRTDRLFLIRAKENVGSLGDAKLGIERFDLRLRDACGPDAPPDRGEQLFLGAPGLLV